MVEVGAVVMVEVVEAIQHFSHHQDTRIPIFQDCTLKRYIAQTLPKTKLSVRTFLNKHTICLANALGQKGKTGKTGKVSESPWIQSSVSKLWVHFVSLPLSITTKRETYKVSLLQTDSFYSRVRGSFSMRELEISIMVSCPNLIEDQSPIGDPDFSLYQWTTCHSSPEDPYH